MTYCSAICFCKQCFIKTQTFCLIYVLLMDAFMIHQRSCAFEMEVVCLTKAKLFTFTEKNCDHSFWKYYTGVVQFSCSVVSDSLQTHRLQHARPPCPSPTPRVYPNSCPLSQWCHPTISSSAVPFSSYLQSFPTSESLRPHESQHTRPPWPSPSPGVNPNPCPLCQWCPPTISPSVIPFSSCPQSFPASGSI